MTLKNSILKEIKSHTDCHRALEDRWDKSFYTIELWLKNNNPLLCHSDSLAIISACLKKEIDEMVVHEESDFKPVV